VVACNECVFSVGWVFSFLFEMGGGRLGDEFSSWVWPATKKEGGCKIILRFNPVL
jgi:hypothetical protein